MLPSHCKKLFGAIFSGVLAHGSVWPSVVFAKEDKPPQAQVVSSKDYRISAGDQLVIGVEPAQELSASVVVQPDGSIQLKLVGRVRAAGLLGEELKDEIERRLRRYVTRPKVSVTVRRFSSRDVTIIGEISSPGSYSYREGMRMLELVGRGNGLSSVAAPARTVIFRREIDGAPHTKTFRVNFKRVLEGDLDRDVELQPGDIVFIPKQKLAKGASWLSGNLLPWLSLVTVVASLVVLADR